MPSRRPSRRSRRSPVYILLALVVLALGFIGVQLSPDLANLLPPELQKLIWPPVVDQSARHPPPGELDIASLPRTPKTFSEAKRLLYEKVYYDHQQTFYCGCTYTRVKGSAGEIDLAGCGVKPRQDPERAKRLEAEHVFPAAQFGNFRQCWREPEKVCGEKMSGRKCCEQSDPVFNAAHNDLHNLFPAEGEINGDRRDYNWGMIPGEKGEHGACAIQIDASLRRAEPPDAVKGEIARTMFYMADTYGFRLSNQDEQLFTAWSRQDPPDAWENERNQRITAIQGRDNRFISQYTAIFGKTAAAPASAPTPVAPATPTAPVATNPVGWTCGAKTTCGQMTSCEEAKFFLNQCGVRSLDRDGDGIPCAALCR